MTRHFLDTEFNGFGGQLISLALVGDDGAEWYNVLPLPDVIDPWVAEHVVPILGKDPVTPEFFRASLIAFLTRHGPVQILADWPADFTHLLHCMLGDDFASAACFPAAFELLTGTDPKPEIPHNALSDARALRDWYKTERDPSRVHRLSRAVQMLRGALYAFGTTPRVIGVPAVDHKSLAATLRYETSSDPTRTGPVMIAGVEIVPHHERGQ